MMTGGWLATSVFLDDPTLFRQSPILRFNGEMNLNKPFRCCLPISLDT